MSVASYLHLESGKNPPASTGGHPFKAVIIIEQDVTADWRKIVSEWLVQNGCLYAMAWGRECSAWDDSIDFANMSEFGFQTIPDHKFVMTTWHEGEALADVFWFSAHAAWHNEVTLDRVLLIDVSDIDREVAMLKLFQEAIHDHS